MFHGVGGWVHGVKVPGGLRLSGTCNSYECSCGHVFCSYLSGTRAVMSVSRASCEQTLMLKTHEQTTLCGGSCVAKSRLNCRMIRITILKARFEGLTTPLTDTVSPRKTLNPQTYARRLITRLTTTYEPPNTSRS